MELLVEEKRTMVTLNLTIDEMQTLYRTLRFGLNSNMNGIRKTPESLRAEVVPEIEAVNNKILDLMDRIQDELRAHDT